MAKKKSKKSKKPFDRIADELDDINKKLDYIIQKQTEDFLNNRRIRWNDGF